MKTQIAMIGVGPAAFGSQVLKTRSPDVSPLERDQAEAGILATSLAPTDAGPGQIITNSPRVPVKAANVPGTLFVASSIATVRLR